MSRYDERSKDDLFCDIDNAINDFFESNGKTKETIVSLVQVVADVITDVIED